MLICRRLNSCCGFSIDGLPMPDPGNGVNAGSARDLFINPYNNTHGLAVGVDEHFYN
jgi:hypothetical protein